MNPTHINIKLIYQDIQQQEYAVKEFLLREKLRSDLLQADPASQGPSKILDTSTPAATAAGGAGGRHRECFFCFDL